MAGVLPKEDQAARDSTERARSNVVVQGSGQWVMPVVGGTWSGGSFMPNQNNHRGRPHEGLDIYASAGSQIVSPVGGVVVASGYSDVGGNYVQIRGSDGNIYYFAHMQYQSNLSVGSVVGAGSPVGLVGNTGSASTTSPHLHLTVKTPGGEIVDIRPLMESATSMTQNSTSAGTSTIPAGMELYEVDGVQYVVGPISSGEASHLVYFKLEPGKTYPGAQVKKITAQQWADITGKGTNGGTTAAFIGVEAGETWQSIIETTLYEMGFFGSDALNDPGVLAVLAAVVARPSMSAEEIQGRLRETQWWKDHTDKQRAWNDKSPAQRELETVDAAAQLAGVWFTYTGQNIDMSSFDLDGDGVISADELKKGNADLYKYATALASGASTQPMLINSWIKAEAEKDENSPWSRTLRNEEKARGEFDVDVDTQAGLVMELYRAYGLDLEWDEALRMGEDLAMNRTSMQDLVMAADEMATALYPNKPKGMTTRSWAQPYTQTMMSVLELPDTDMKDPMLQRALADGLTIGDFRKQLKNDDRWLETKNARDEFHGTLSGLGNQMGF